MKKYIISIMSCLLFGFVVRAQFNPGNAPVIGNSIPLFVLDSAATDYATVTGSGVTWDYSTTNGYTGMPAKLISAVAPNSTTNGGSFPSATIAINIPDFIINYNQETGGSRISHGFVFHEPTIGDIIATFSTDQETLINYLYNYGDPMINDTYSGNVTLNPGTPMSGPVTGVSHVILDGVGTLKLAQNNYPNVTRYVLTDTSNANIPSALGNILVTVIRKTYEYYDLTQNNLPIFIYSHFEMSSANPLVTPNTYNLVLSKDDPNAASTCLPVTGLSVSNITTNSADFTWNGTAGDNFEYVLDQVNADPTGNGTPISATSLSMSGLTPNTQYYFHIRRICGIGNNSSWSSIGFTTLSTPSCTEIQNLVVSNITSNSATISWPISTNYESILDQVAAVPTGNGNPAIGSSFNANGLTPNTQYYFHIRKFCSGYFSNWTTATFTTASLGVNENLTQQFKVYPIPTSNLINIEIPNNLVAQIKIIDNLGRTVYESKTTDAENKINVSEFTKGIYFVNIIAKDYNITRKIVIK